MAVSRNLVFFVFLLLFSQCKKETDSGPCINMEQKNRLLQSMQSLLSDTTQLSAAERQFMNEIRTIANDIDPLTSDVDTTAPLQDIYTRIKSNFLQIRRFGDAKSRCLLPWFCRKDHSCQKCIRAHEL